MLSMDDIYLIKKLAADGRSASSAPLAKALMSCPIILASALSFLNSSHSVSVGSWTLKVG